MLGGASGVTWGALGRKVPVLAGYGYSGTHAGSWENPACTQEDGEGSPEEDRRAGGGGGWSCTAEPQGSRRMDGHRDQGRTWARSQLVKAIQSAGPWSLIAGTGPEDKGEAWGSPAGGTVLSGRTRVKKALGAWSMAGRLPQVLGAGGKGHLG